MIERESGVKVYSEVLGAKGAKGKFVRTQEQGYYEVTLDVQGKQYTAYLPIASTVLLAADAEPEIAALDVER